MMRAAVLRDTRHIEVAGVPDPEPADDEVVIEMRAVGICGSDLHAYRGQHPFRKPPVVLGHEGSGVITAIPRHAAGLRVGDRVTVMPVLSCWSCRRCESGMPHLCAHKRVPGSGWPGFLSHRITAPSRVVFPLADGIGYCEGAMTEPVAVACHAARTGEVSAGQSVAVLGAGTIGALVAGVSRLRGASVVMVSDIRADRLRIAERLGGTHTVDAGAESVTETGLALNPDGFDVVVIASGHPRCVDEALTLCRPRGTVVVLPLFPRPITAEFTTVVLKEARLVGSTIYTPEDFRQALDLINGGRLDVGSFVDDPLPLERTAAVFAAIDEGDDTLKAHIDPSA